MNGESACRRVIQGAWRGTKIPGAAHAGLVLAACLQNQDKPEERQQVLQQARHAVREPLSIYGMAFKRWKKSLEKGSPEPRGKVLYVHGRMAIGLGTESVLEVGLTLHHTYGTPIIPGSALKGLAAHYCDQVWGHADERFKAPHDKDEKTEGGENGPGSCYRFIFGTQQAAGYFTFHDAWMTPESLEKDPLCVDIMTPHHSDYYSAEGDKKPPPPWDFDDPIPISFLSVRGVFHVAVSCELPGDEGDQWSGLVFELLGQAFENWGIGAKTTAGYGRMHERPPATPGIPEEPEQEQVKPSPSIGDRIKVKRIEDPKGKNRLFFKAEDGTRCQVSQAEDPSKDVPVDGEVELWVVNAAQDIYTLSSVKPKEKKGKPKKSPRR